MARINRFCHFFVCLTPSETLHFLKKKLPKTFEQIEMIGAWNGTSFFFWRDFFQNIQITFCCIISFCKSNSSLLAWLMKKKWSSISIWLRAVLMQLLLLKKAICVYINVTKIWKQKINIEHFLHTVELMSLTCIVVD